MKKKVHIYQIQAPSAKNLIPLAAANIVAMARNIPEINKNYCLQIKVLREDLEDVIKYYRSDKVHIAAFSVYLWNFRQSLEVAKIIKQIDPFTLVIFGGQMISLSPNIEEVELFFRNYPFVDILVHGMGEWVFSEILLEYLSGSDWGKISGVSYRNHKDNCINMTLPIYKRPLDELPSPFLDGTLDEVMGMYRHTITGVLWETSRGCPYRCAFCYQGNDIFNAIIPFDTRRLESELEWISNNKIDYIHGTDSNFGVLKRDSELIEKIIEMNIRTGYPKVYLVSWLKNSSQRVINGCERLAKNNLFARMTLSRQTFNEITLEAINRKNIKELQHEELIHLSAKIGIPSYIELILGLPEETYDSFSDGLEKSMISNLNHGFVVYLCRLLPGTEMKTASMARKYKFETRACKIGIERQRYACVGVDEYEDIVVGTSTMSIDDWRRSHKLYCSSLSLFNYRIAFFVLIYLRQQYHVKITDILEYIIDKGLHDRQYSSIRRAIDKVTEREMSILEEELSMVFTDYTEDILYQAHEAMLIIILSMIDDFYAELFEIIKEYLNLRKYEVNDDILREVFLYQRIVVPTWIHNNNVGCHEFKFNIPQYFYTLCKTNSGIPIEEEVTVVETTGAVYSNAIYFIQNRLSHVIFSLYNIKSCS